MKGIQTCSSDVPRPFSRGDNYGMAKYIDEIYESSPEPLNKFQSNLATASYSAGNSNELRETQGFTNKDHSVLKKLEGALWVFFFFLKFRFWFLRRYLKEFTTYFRIVDVISP